MALLAIGGGGMFFVCIWVAGRFFPLEEVVVRGGENLPKGVLESAIANYIPNRECLFLFNGHRLIERLKEEGGVLSVQLRRRLPNTLIVEVVEREPAAILKQGRQRWVCDRQGVILKTQDGAAEDLPVVEVEGFALDQPEPGQRIADERLRAALQAVCFLREQSTETVEMLRLTPRGGIEIKLARGPLLKLGPPVRMEEKLKICLGVLEKSWKDSRVNLVDLSLPDCSYYELTTAESPMNAAEQ